MSVSPVETVRSLVLCQIQTRGSGLCVISRLELMMSNCQKASERKQNIETFNSLNEKQFRRNLHTENKKKSADSPRDSFLTFNNLLFPLQPSRPPCVYSFLCGGFRSVFYMLLPSETVTKKINK